MSAAFAHGISGADEHHVFGWSFEPWVLTPIILVALLYARGSAKLEQRRKALRTKAHLWFWSGLTLLALALMSPLHTYGAAVFTAHMIEHEILMVVAVPLIVAARPGPVLLWGFPQSMRRGLASAGRSSLVKGLWGAATELVSATALHAVVLWVWHVPALFEAAVENEAIHIAQHLSFIFSAIFFWTAIFDRDRRRYGQGAAALALFLTSLQAGALGALLTFSGRLWYPNGPDPFDICGLTRGEDQSLAGLIMWIPACTIYVLAAICLLFRWLGQLEKRHA